MPTPRDPAGAAEHVRAMLDRVRRRAAVRHAVRAAACGLGATAIVFAATIPAPASMVMRIAAGASRRSWRVSRCWRAARRTHALCSGRDDRATVSVAPKSPSPPRADCRSGSRAAVHAHSRDAGRGHGLVRRRRHAYRSLARDTTALAVTIVRRRPCCLRGSRSPRCRAWLKPCAQRNVARQRVTSSSILLRLRMPGGPRRTFGILHPSRRSRGALPQSR